MTPKALKNINPLAGVAGLVVTAAVLVAAISFTQHGEFPWVAFLSGLLFAAVLALVYRVTNTNSTIAALRHDLRRFEDDLPLMVAYAGADEVIRSHNRAFRDWLRVRRELVDGHQLREGMGATTTSRQPAAIVAHDEVSPAASTVPIVAPMPSNSPEISRSVCLNSSEVRYCEYGS